MPGHMRWMNKQQSFPNAAPLTKCKQRMKVSFLGFHLFFRGDAQPWLFTVYKSHKELGFLQSWWLFFEREMWEGRNVAKRQKYCVWILVLDLNLQIFSTVPCFSVLLLAIFCAIFASSIFAMITAYSASFLPGFAPMLRNTLNWYIYIFFNFLTLNPLI